MQMVSKPSITTPTLQERGEFEAFLVSAITSAVKASGYVLNGHTLNAIATAAESIASSEGLKVRK